jgi:hypothetical protein
MIPGTMPEQEPDIHTVPWLSMGLLNNFFGVLDSMISVLYNRQEEDL